MAAMLHKQRIASLFGAIVVIALWYMFSSNKLSYATTNDPDLLKSTPIPQQQKVAAIMPAMPDPEAKKELGRAAWKYFHTLLARYPDEPSEQEREKLTTFLHLYAELYPCGECSVHFVNALKKYPPQTSSRFAAAMWGCHIHNKVNAFLEKPEYDCTKILEDYDCGCGDENGKISDALKLNGVSLEKEGKQGG